MSENSLIRNSEGLARVWLIVIIVVSVLVVGGVGYVLGQNKAESDAEAKNAAQVEKLQKDLNEAKSKVSDSAEAGQDSLETLQAENKQLQADNDAKDKKIAELEQQLEDANAEDSATPPAAQ